METLRTKEEMKRVADAVMAVWIKRHPAWLLTIIINCHTSRLYFLAHQEENLLRVLGCLEVVLVAGIPRHPDWKSVCFAGLHAVVSSDRGYGFLLCTRSRKGPQETTWPSSSKAINMFSGLEDVIPDIPCIFAYGKGWLSSRNTQIVSISAPNRRPAVHVSGYPILSYKCVILKGQVSAASKNCLASCCQPMWLNNETLSSSKQAMFTVSDLFRREHTVVISERSHHVVEELYERTAQLISRGKFESKSDNLLMKLA
ncbi:uncharacterized protein ARMOST_12159 [Armillaria ostoyae]|uniref:Uncharacterized protein n=1 Tax=Armillaria ostoyae TaxID=47428 RepID=A0A284RJ48_ARMOS|nr:uncharacterized protein ARMOST_12159 [Armillaria ostoyae]